MVRTIVEREPQFDEEQHDLAAALEDYEHSLNELGIPIDEAMSVGADPGNKDGTHRYVATSAIDWSVYERDRQQKESSYEGDPYGRSRKFVVTRVDR